LKNKKEILVLGGSGYLGTEFSSFIGRDKALQTYYTNKIEGGIFFDLKKNSVKEILKSYSQIKYIVLGAGIFDFKRISSNLSQSFFYNVECMKRIINEINMIGIKFIFLSSESVFDGKKGNYVETDDTNPTFEYAKQKDLIEKYILSNAKNFLIIRLSKVYDLNMLGNKLIANWYRKLKNNDDIWCANDNVFSPIHLLDACRSISDLINKDASGIFHLSSLKPYSRKDMLKMLLSRYLLKHDYKGKIKYKSLNEFQGSENQPLNTSLLPKKLKKTINFCPRDIEEWINKLDIK
jgi:dTDP-4-dehydrorhamnose reductase